MSNGASSAYQAIAYILVTIGYFGIFKKCGVKRFWALIPFAREYHLSLCADKEEDGRKYAIIDAALMILMIWLRMLDPERNITLMLLLFIPAMALAFAGYIYKIRISLGLIKVFERSKWWIVIFILCEWVASMIWGCSKSFKPSKKVIDLKNIDGARVSGAEADDSADCLTVNINKREAFDFFKKKTLLRDIHMNIPKGHMVLLLGGSGAGKTTFVNAVTGYEKADAKITLGEGDIYRDYAKMMYDVGFVPQQDLMRGNDTVLLTLTDAATLRLPSDVSWKEKKRRINEVLELFGLYAVRNSLVEKLSGGQRKRLSIAMEFISDPTLFILDEPDSGLDGVVARALFEKLRQIADEGKIVVVITHTPDRVIDLFDDVIVLAKDSKRTGRLSWYGPVSEAYEFFGKKSMEEILLSVNQKDEGGEGRADEFVEKYSDRMKEMVG